ncbi:sister chromatid cohesion 1 protein 2-like isoform X2 [Prosopis cineraria]|uniref:sister chromatid cohesion 1 protein 2-like isoform X2 n=1 Tax=Prosopis cineraria TaxID=364024 RepID=UPI0024101800|nr:sister chromatid cohesion 1 protein 2-like isoform X2 [Prosopis cineraria]
MCYSKCLVSRKGAIWVAAYCFKKLKKAQVKETDISSSVDKILQDEMNFDSYRVTSYLLLGVVKIYSKKVEYLHHDCNEVLIKIKKFTIDTQKNARKETLRMSITVPDRFELDAFDLEIVEDDGWGNIAPKEDITLKDVLWKDEGIGQFSLDKYQYEESDFCQNSCPADPLILEDFQQSQLMDNYEVSPPNSPINLQVRKDKFQDRLFSEEISVNLDSIFGVEGVRTDPIKLSIQNQQIDKEQTIAETAPYEDDMHDERSLEKIISCGISQEELEDVRMFTRREEGPEVSVAVSRQVGEEHIKARETANLECQIHQEIGEVHVATSPPRSMEGLQDDKCNKKECLEDGRSSIAKEKIEKFVVESAEKHDNAGELKLLEKDSNKDGKFGEEKIKVNETANSECQVHLEIEEFHEARDSPVGMERLQDDMFNKKDCMDPDRSSSAKEKVEKLVEGSVKKHHKKGRLKLQEVSVEVEKFHIIPPESNILDITPQTKFQNDSVAKPKQGATMLESMHISTPAVKERARFPRKRKCVFDGLIILPNEVLRQSIHDTSDLISKRRKVPCPVIAAWKASRVSSLPEGFYESLLPCHSLELQILFSKKKIKMLNSIKIVETPGKLDESESQTVDKVEHSEPAPNTPPQCSTSRPIYFQDSKETTSSDNIRPSSPYECIERKKSLKRDGELHLVKEGNLETSSWHASITGEQYLRKDEELDLMIEETNSIETENSDLCGWSRRTTKVARYLQRHFLDLGKQREENVLNFSQVLLGRAKKDCARLFYEVLVLRTTSCLDVMQNNAYGDISIRKLSQLDQSFGVDEL